MSRTLDAAMVTHLAGTTHTRCAMLRLDLKDGTVLAVTDHDYDLDFDLGDGSVTYLRSTGIAAGDLELSAGFDADDMEVTGPIGDDVTAAAVIGGRYDDATARFFQVNWASLASGPVRLLKGYVAQASVEGGRFRFTIHSEISKLAQMVGRMVSGTCDADFGDARCTKARVELAATVTGVTDEMRFTVSFSGSHADNFFNLGEVEFATGDLAGTRPVEILDWTAAGLVTLFGPLAALPGIGDTLTIRNGCSLLRKSDDPAVPTCLTHDNVVNFRGFPDLKGSDKVLRVSVPGER